MQKRTDTAPVITYSTILEEDTQFHVIVPSSFDTDIARSVFPLLIEPDPEDDGSESVPLCETVALAVVNVANKYPGKTFPVVMLLLIFVREALRRVASN